MKEHQMSRQRYTSSELDARLKFILGSILGIILLGTSLGILYGLLFVSQPIGAQSENDKMFFNVLGSIATFITGTLAGILIGKSGADEVANMGNTSGEATPTEPTPVPTEPEPTGKPEGQVPDEQPIDEDWDKE
jgi:NhaP-type Na+/H+ or K+/H+ antiporter